MNVCRDVVSVAPHAKTARLGLIIAEVAIAEQRMVVVLLLLKLLIGAENVWQVHHGRPLGNIRELKWLLLHLFFNL